MPTIPPVSDIKVYVPAINFSHCHAFYEALGWKTNWNHSGLAEMELGGVRFFLQDYYQKDWAENFMLYINVPDVDVWYSHVSEVLASGQFPKARARAPQKMDYGDTVSHVWDPSGVLLHFAQSTKA